jgi:hypothetical protein
MDTEIYYFSGTFEMTSDMLISDIEMAGDRDVGRYVEASFP